MLFVALSQPANTAADRNDRDQKLFDEWIHVTKVENIDVPPTNPTKISN